MSYTSWWVELRVLNLELHVVFRWETHNDENANTHGILPLLVLNRLGFVSLSFGRNMFELSSFFFFLVCLIFLFVVFNMAFVVVVMVVGLWCVFEHD